MVTFQTTPLTSLFIDNMSEDQVWEQLDLRTKNICQMLELILGGQEDGGIELSTERLGQSLETLEDGEDIELDDFADGIDTDEDSLDQSDDEEDEEDTESESGDTEDIATEDVVGLHDSSSSEDSDHDENSSSMIDVTSKSNAPLPKKRREHPQAQLDDGFFNLVSFNAETERAEAKTSSSGHLGEEGDSDSDDISIDLFAPLDQVEYSDDEDDAEEEAGELFYHDFFEPPLGASLPRAKTKPKGNLPDSSGQVRFHDEVKVLKIKARGKNLPVWTTEDADSVDDDDDHAPVEQEIIDGGDDDSDGEGQRGQITIDRLKDDLFAEEDGLHQDLSTHERRMASLQKEIEELESANVGPKDWVLMGEAGSRTRPQNSLLEEDLEFERVTKAVPLVTEEIVQALEERIKARILDGRFDDVIRIRPIDDKPFLPSRFFELKDTKSTRSLAQIYENEFVAEQMGDVAGDDRDGKLKKEHDEIEKIWESICGKLDALCNAHFIPKQPKAVISTVSNVSTTTLESSLPTTESTTTMLAPEEVFAPLSAEPRARSELTPAEKRALRGKERKSRKKSRDALDKAVDKFARKRSSATKNSKQKQSASESVVRRGKGITVIGKKARTH